MNRSEICRNVSVTFDRHRTTFECADQGLTCTRHSCGHVNPVTWGDHEAGE